MIIYTDEENRISISGTKHEIPDDHPLALMSETKRLCYIYDNGSFYPFIDTDEIKRLDMPTHLECEFNGKKNMIMCEQIKTVNVDELLSYMFTLDDNMMDGLTSGLDMPSVGQPF